MQPLVSNSAPPFQAEYVKEGAIQKLSLSDLSGNTFVCPTEIIAFNDRIEDFRKLNCEVLAISVDSVYSHLAWANQPRKDGGLSPVKIPLVSDIKKTIAADYRVLVNDSVALRGLFIIDGKGIIRQATINDLPIGRSVDETLRLIEAIQFHDKHGEVCPANWKPGSATVYIHPLSAHRSSLNLKAPRPTSSSRTSNTAKPIV